MPAREDAGADGEAIRARESERELQRAGAAPALREGCRETAHFNPGMVACAGDALPCVAGSGDTMRARRARPALTASGERVFWARG